MMIEPLESRRMLTVTTSFAFGVLTVTSDEAADHVRIDAGDHGGVFVYAGHHLVGFVHTLNEIHVNLNGGDDSLDTDRGINAPMRIHGGAGNDALAAGSGHDLIFGDDGNDLIRSNDGVIDTVDGGPGDDTALVDRVDVVISVEHVHYGHHHHHTFTRAFDEIRSNLD